MFTVTGLTRDTVYWFALRARGAGEVWSEYSNAVRVETGDPEPPGRIVDLAAVETEPRAVTLTWTAPGDDGDLGTAMEYELRRSGEPLGPESWEGAEVVPYSGVPQSAGSTEELRVSGLEVSSRQYFAIRARDDGGQWGKLSNVLEVRLPEDDVPPGTIVDLGVESGELSEVHLRWTAPGNDGSEARVAGYRIRYLERAIGTEGDWEEAEEVAVTLEPGRPGESESLTLRELPGRKRLWFAVRGEDEAGNLGGVSKPAWGDVWGEPRVWRVREDGSGDAPGIQAAIEGASHGDEVVVGPGVYYENVDFLGKAIRVRSEEGPARTTIDGSRGDTSVVTFRSGEDRRSVIEGFTVTGGKGINYGGRRSGGGVHCGAASPTIRGNVIVRNRVAGDFEAGGGVAIIGRSGNSRSEASPLVIDNVIAENRAGGNGGGVVVYGHASPRIQNNMFHSNASKFDGGGLALFSSAGSAEITGNVFVENSAGDHGGGVALAPSRNDLVHLEYNIFDGNRAEGNDSGDPVPGGGIWVVAERVLVANNTFVRNGIDESGAPGASAILVQHCKGGVTIARNLIAYNGGSGIRCEASDQVEWDVNLFWMNEKGSYSQSGCPSVSPTSFVVDPEFCDKTLQAYGLKSTSPAISGEEVIGAVKMPACD